MSTWKNEKEYIIKNSSSKQSILRCAREEDLRIIYRWQKSKDCRKNFKNKKIPTWSQHRNWFNKMLSDKGGTYLIVVLNNKEIGYVRCIRVANNEADISIYIASEYRGLGVSREAVVKLISISSFKFYRAVILKYNRISRRFFKSLGFKRKGKGGDVFVYRKK